MKKITSILLLLLTITCTANAQKYTVTMKTDKGTIKMMLYDGTPQHRDNFVKLIKKGFYDSLLFHRIIPAFMIQGGDPDSKRSAAGSMLGEGDVGYRIPAEIVPAYYHKRGALAAARDNNPDKASSGCQFYIVVGKTFDDAGMAAAVARGAREATPEQKTVYKTLGGTPHLDGNYTVFGEVTEGMDVVDKIVVAPRNPSDRPLTDIHILNVKVKKKRKFLFLF